MLPFLKRTAAVMTSVLSGGRSAATEVAASAEPKPLPPDLEFLGGLHLVAVEVAKELSGMDALLALHWRSEAASVIVPPGADEQTAFLSKLQTVLVMSSVDLPTQSVCCYYAFSRPRALACVSGRTHLVVAGNDDGSLTLWDVSGAGASKLLPRQGLPGLWAAPVCTAEPALQSGSGGELSDGSQSIVAIRSSDPVGGADAALVVLDESGTVTVWRVMEVMPLVERFDIEPYSDFSAK